QWIGDQVVDVRGSEISSVVRYPDQGRAVFLSDAVHIDISSTDIRERIAAGLSVRYKIPAEVERYIRAHGLYRSDDVPREVAS
ncbi:MAG: hypothetical protein WBM46_19940, partial [Polyangiales bacterium]